MNENNSSESFFVIAFKVLCVILSMLISSLIFYTLVYKVYSANKNTEGIVYAVNADSLAKYNSFSEEGYTKYTIVFKCYDDLKEMALTDASFSSAIHFSVELTRLNKDGEHIVLMTWDSPSEMYNVENDKLIFTKLGMQEMASCYKKYENAKSECFVRVNYIVNDSAGVD